MSEHVPDRADDECVVCWNPTDVHVGPCNHRICTSCASRWLQRNPTCPYCRLDTFGMVLENPSVNVVAVSIPHGTHAGIKLSCATNGVRVDRVVPRDRCAAAGLRRGMVLESFNGVPCKTPSMVIRMFHACTGHVAHLMVRDERRRGTWSTYFSYAPLHLARVTRL